MSGHASGRAGGLFVGRLVAENGVGTLAEALDLYPGARLDVIGAGPEETRLAWAEAFPEKMRQMGECAKADYQARFLADWSYQRLFGERRRAARV